MKYTKQTWTDGVTVLDAATMEHIEQGIADVADAVMKLQENGGSGNTGGNSGFTDTAKTLILSLFESAAYGNAAMQSQLDALKTEFGKSTGGGDTPTVVPVTSVTLNKSTLSLTEGSSETLTATVLPSNATNKTVTWTVSPSGYATVSGGVVSAVKAGSCTVTATAGGKSASCAVTVVASTVTLPTPVYKLAAAKTFAAENQEYIDTGVKLFSTIDPKPTWTILLEVQGDSLTAVGDTYVLAHCMEELSPWPGLNVAIWGGKGDLGVNLYKASGQLVNLSYLNENKVRIAIQIDGATFTTRTNTSMGNYTSAAISSYAGTVDKTLIIGGYQTRDGTKGRFWNGTVYQFAVFNSALSTSLMESWINGEASIPDASDTPAVTTPV